jgi:hypothetical protein
MYITMETEAFDFSRFGEGAGRRLGGEYEMETFKTISGDVEDNERLVPATTLHT